MLKLNIIQALLIASIGLFTLDTAFAAKPEDGSVFFENVKNEQDISINFKLKMGVKGKSIKNAGEVPEDKMFGHHHLIIDGSFVPEGQVVSPNIEGKIMHFGKGQTEMELKLAPGKHTLTLQFADGAHRSYGEKMSATVTVNVK